MDRSRSHSVRKRDVVFVATAAVLVQDNAGGCPLLENEDRRRGSKADVVPVNGSLLDNHPGYDNLTVAGSVRLETAWRRASGTAAPAQPVGSARRTGTALRLDLQGREAVVEGLLDRLSQGRPENASQQAVP